MSAAAALRQRYVSVGRVPAPSEIRDPFVPFEAADPRGSESETRGTPLPLPSNETESDSQTEGENISKLEKADILELTVRHLQKLQTSRPAELSTTTTTTTTTTTMTMMMMCDGLKYIYPEN